MQSSEKSVGKFMQELRDLGVYFEYRAVSNDGRVFQSKNYRHVDCARAVIPYLGLKYEKKRA